LTPRYRFVQELRKLYATTHVLRMELVRERFVEKRGEISEPLSSDDLDSLLAREVRPSLVKLILANSKRISTFLISGREDLHR
jgi:phage FluMu protein gp41